MPSPPNELRRAADLLETARAAPPGAERDRMLADVRDVCARVIAGIDLINDPIAQLGALLRESAAG